MQQLSAMEVLEWQGWAVAELTLPSATASSTKSKSSAASGSTPTPKDQQHRQSSSTTSTAIESENQNSYSVFCEGVRQFFIDDEAHIFPGDSFAPARSKGYSISRRLRRRINILSSCRSNLRELQVSFGAVCMRSILHLQHLPEELQSPR